MKKWNLNKNTDWQAYKNKLEVDLDGWETVKNDYINGKIDINLLYDFIQKNYKRCGYKNNRIQETKRQEKKEPKEIRLAVKKRNAAEKKWKNALKQSDSDIQENVKIEKLYYEYMEKKERSWDVKKRTEKL